MITTAPTPQAGSSGGGGAPSKGGAAGQAGSTPSGSAHFLAVGLSRAATTDLAGRLKVDLDAEAEITAVFTDQAGHTVKVASKAPSKGHELRFFGLRAGRTYTAKIHAKTGDGGGADATPMLYTTQPLPADFPPIEVAVADPARPGYTMFPVSRFVKGGVDQGWGYLVAVDGAGEVVWYAFTGRDLSDVRRTKAGLVRVIAGTDGFGDLDLLDGPKSGVLAVGLDPQATLVPGVVGAMVDTLHHDAIELPSGNALALGTERRTIHQTDCPKTYDKDYDVVGDVIVEIEPSTGKIVSKISLFDMLDPCRRVDTAFKSQFWASTYGKDSADWTHANSVFYDEKTDTVLVSLRHQDWVIAYHKGSDGKDVGKLLWRLGPEGDFAFVGDGALPPYHQHAAKLLPNGHLALYDNGTTRPGTDDLTLSKLPVSRAVELALDTSGGPGSFTAKEVFVFGPHDERAKDPATGASIPWYASVVGDFDLTAEGTALVTHGCVTDPANTFVFDDDARRFARVVEVTHDAAQKIVLDLRVRDPKPAGFQSYLVFRAERHATLDWAP